MKRNEEEMDIPSIYRPLSMWEYFGYQLLYGIPIVGFIFLIIHAFGNTTNINRRNFARSYFCIFIVIAIVIGLLIGVFGAASVGSFVGDTVNGFESI